MSSWRQQALIEAPIDVVWGLVGDPKRHPHWAGGVVGVTMVRSFVSAGATATINDVLDHIDHVAKLVGVEHVGLGTDVDLEGRDPASSLKRKYDLDGVDYAKKIFDLTEGLLKRNYSAAHVELVLGGNFQRALSEIWDPSA